MIKLVYLVFEEFSKLSAGKIDLILVLYFTVFQLVEEFDKGLDYFVERRGQFLTVKQVNVLFYDMTHDCVQKEMQNADFNIYPLGVRVQQIDVLLCQPLISKRVNGIWPYLVNWVRLNSLLYDVNFLSKLAALQAGSVFVVMVFPSAH